MSAAVRRQPLIERLWIYQAERFPVFKHGIAIAAFALAGAALPSLLGGAAFDPWTGVVATAVTFLFFLQLRIADEHKDFADDSRYRPERAVPRGLVTLGELRVVGFAAAPVQAALAWSIDPLLLLPLALVWAWMALMSAEFFAPEALKARPVLYLVSHMAVTPLIAAFAVACGWLAADPAPQPSFAYAAFLALAFANGLVIEISRKSWALADERPGVESYSKLWGSLGAGAVAAAAMLLSAGLSLSVLAGAGAHVGFTVAAVLCAAIGIIGAAHFAVAPTSAHAKRFGSTAAFWVLASYLLLGLGPLVVGGAS